VPPAGPRASSCDAPRTSLGCSRHPRAGRTRHPEHALELRRRAGFLRRRRRALGRRRRGRAHARRSGAPGDLGGRGGRRARDRGAARGGASWARGARRAARLDARGAATVTPRDARSLARAAASRDGRRQRTARRTRLGPLLAHRSRGRRARGARDRSTDPLAPPARSPRRGDVLREQPLLPRGALRQPRALHLPPRALRPSLVERAPRAPHHHRHGRRSQARAHDHGQQHPLRARRGRTRHRRDARPARTARDAGLPLRGRARPPRLHGRPRGRRARHGRGRDRTTPRAHRGTRALGPALGTSRVSVDPGCARCSGRTEPRGALGADRDAPHGEQARRRGDGRAARAGRRSRRGRSGGLGARRPRGLPSDLRRALKTGRDGASSAELGGSLSRTVVGDTARNRATFRQTLLDGSPRPAQRARHARSSTSASTASCSSRPPRIRGSACRIPRCGTRSSACTESTCHLDGSMRVARARIGGREALADSLGEREGLRPELPARNVGA
jgi:hypothetical protein